MVTITRSMLPTQGQLPPVSGVCRWKGLVPTLTSLDLGSAWLQVETARGALTNYWVARLTLNGRLEGFRLTRFDEANGETGEIYDVDCRFDRTDSRHWACSCPDHTFRGHRRAAGQGCKHIKAIFNAVKRLGLL